MTTTHPSVVTSRLGARRVHRVALGATLGLLALGLAIGPAQAASVTAKITNNTLIVTGTKSADVIVLRLAAGDPNTLEIDLGGDGSAEFAFDRSTFDKIQVGAGDGSDTLRIDQSGGLFTDTEVTRLDGGAGADTLIGGSGPETLLGGAGDDVLDGNQGSDTVSGGTGADTVVWDPGDGSDTVEGGDGIDTLAFNGSNAGELMDVSANGKRVRFSRNIGTVVMDLGTLERLDIRALGGADVVTVGSLAGTGLARVSVDLAATIGGGDGSADSVVVNGTAANDVIAVNAVGGAVETSGLAAVVRVVGPESLDALRVDGLVGADTVVVNGTAGPDAFDVVANGTVASVGGSPFGAVRIETADEVLRVNGLDGADTFGAAGDLASITGLVLDGGAGGDLIRGGNGADVLIGGASDDVLDGNQGSDTVSGGSGADTVVWDPGDGSDTVEGGDGIDTLAFNGSNAGELLDVSANGKRVRFSRNIGTVVMDLGTLERLDIRALGGADVVTVGSLAGTGLARVSVDLAATIGGGDGSADSVVVNGTAANDVIAVNAVGGAVETSGLAAVVRVVGPESLDALRVDGLVGADTVVVNGTAGPDAFDVVANGTVASVGGSPFGAVRIETADEVLRVNGLDGADTFGAAGDLASITGLVLDGGAGGDLIRGGNGADVLIGGASDDVLDGNQGSDTVSGGSGADTVVWDPGDGSDTVEGGDGIDTLAFNGSNAGELLDVSANGKRVRFSRNIGTVVMDLGTLERLDIRALGGADVVTVGSLAGTGLARVSVDLAATIGGGDGSADSVVVNGTAAADVIAVNAVGGAVETSGLAAVVRVVGAEPALDTLTVNGLAGNDVINVGTGVQALIQLVLNP